MNPKGLVGALLSQPPESKDHRLLIQCAEDVFLIDTVQSLPVVTPRCHKEGKVRCFSKVKGSFMLCGYSL